MNGKVVRDFIERGLNAHDEEATRSFLTPDFIAHVGPRSMNLAAYLAMRRDGWSWSDDWRIRIEDVVDGGDRVAVRALAEGHHTGTARTHLGEAKATQRVIHTSWIAIYRLVDGKIAESWTESDLPRLWHELGVLA